MGTGSIPPVGPLGYEGVVAPNFIMRTFNPTPQFNKFPISTIWINTQSSTAYILVNLELGIATWLPLGCSCNIGIQTITTPDAVVVSPIAGNINFLQSGNINITGSGNDVTFTVAGGGLTWIDVITPAINMVADTGYVVDAGGLCTLTLPVSAPQGSIINVVGKSPGGWQVFQNPGQQMFNGKSSTTPGVGGYLASTFQRDCIELLCVTANTEFQVMNEVGNITYA